MVLSTGNQQAIEAAEILVIAWVVLSAAAAMPWIVGQWLRFVPLRSEKRD
jgi:hypothetical protein